MSSLESAAKSYPIKAKAEITALGHLQKGLLAIEKSQEARIK